MIPPKAKADQLTDEKYARIGREIEKLLVINYIDSLHSTRRQIWSSLVRGIFSGLGGVLGATLGVAILLFVLRYLGSHLPLVGQYFRHLSDSIKSTRY